MNYLGKRKTFAILKAYCDIGKLKLKDFNYHNGNGAEWLRKNYDSAIEIYLETRYTIRAFISQFEIDEETETETVILRLCVDNPLTAQEKIIYKSVRDKLVEENEANA